MVFVAAWTALVLPACEEDTPETGSVSPNGELSASASGEPEGLDVEQIKASSFDDLAAEVAERGANVLLVLPGAQPTEVHFWGGDEHLHIRTEYIDRRGEEIVIIQAKFDEGDSLTEGKAVSIHGHRGVQADRHWY